MPKLCNITLVELANVSEVNGESGFGLNILVGGNGEMGDCESRLLLGAGLLGGLDCTARWRRTGAIK